MIEKETIRVVIVDNQAIVRSGLSTFILAYPQLQMIGEAEDGQEAVQLCELVQPDLVLMDLRMPVMDGIAATRIIRQRWPHIKVLVLTNFTEKDLVQKALEAGASGYLLKNISAAELHEAILQAMQGRQIVAPDATQAMLRARRLEQIDAEIRATSPSLESLHQLLQLHLPAMFPNCQIQLRIFPDRSLYNHPAQIFQPLSDAAWSWLQGRSEITLFSPGMTYPWGGEHGDNTFLILAPVILESSLPAAGGLCLLRKGPADQPEDILPVVQSLTSLLAAAFKKAGAAVPQTARQQKIATQELEWAGRVQAGMLPEQPPSIPGWDIAARLVPARETSGDFFDFIVLPNGKWGIVIADVTDKGLGAAVFMALSTGLIRTYASRYPTLPGLAVSSVNDRILSDTRGSIFLTAFYGVLEPEIGRLRYVNAGHNPPFLISTQRGKPYDRLTRTGMALGISNEGSWQQKIIRFTPGDFLLMYTDGITEARSPSGSYFGEQRLLDATRSMVGRPAQEILAAVLAELERFTGGARREDDVAVIVLARRP